MYDLILKIKFGTNNSTKLILQATSLISFVKVFFCEFFTCILYRRLYMPYNWQSKVLNTIPIASLNRKKVNVYISTPACISSLLSSLYVQRLMHIKTEKTQTICLDTFLFYLNNLCGVYYLMYSYVGGVDLPAFVPNIYSSIPPHICFVVHVQQPLDHIFHTHIHTSITMARRSQKEYMIASDSPASNHNTHSTCATRYIFQHNKNCTNKMCEYEWISRMNGVCGILQTPTHIPNTGLSQTRPIQSGYSSNLCNTLANAFIYLSNIFQPHPLSSYICATLSVLSNRNEIKTPTALFAGAIQLHAM